MGGLPQQLEPSPRQTLSPTGHGGRWGLMWPSVLPWVGPDWSSSGPVCLVAQTHCYVHNFTYKLSLKAARGYVRMVKQKGPNGMNKTLLERNDQSIWYYQFHTTFLHSVMNLLSLLLQVGPSPIYLRLSSVTICPECHMFWRVYCFKFSVKERALLPSAASKEDTHLIVLTTFVTEKGGRIEQ